MSADAKVELVARAIALEFSGGKSDNPNGAEIAAARAAITALEASHSRTEAMIVEAGQEFLYGLDHKFGCNAEGRFDEEVERQDIIGFYTAMQAARPIDQQEAIERDELKGLVELLIERVIEIANSIPPPNDKAAELMMAATTARSFLHRILAKHYRSTPPAETPEPGPPVKDDERG